MHREGGGEAVVRAEPASRHGATAGFDPPPKVRDRAWPERHVDKRVPLEDQVALGLCIASAHRHHELGVPPFAGGDVTEVRSEPGVRLLPDRARVEDEDVGLLRPLCLAQAERLEHALDPLGIVSVHLAAERGDVVALVHRER